MKKEKVIETLKVHRTHCRNVGDKVYADALNYAIQALSKLNNKYISVEEHEKEIKELTTFKHAYNILNREHTQLEKEIKNICIMLGGNALEFSYADAKKRIIELIESYDKLKQQLSKTIEKSKISKVSLRKTIEIKEVEDELDKKI